MVRAPKTRIGTSYKVAWAALLVLLLSPIFVLLVHLISQDVSWSLDKFDGPEFVWALKNSFSLGLYSAGLSLLVGFILSFGIHFLEAKHSKWALFFRQALLFPIYLPPFYIILIFFYWFTFVPLGVLSSTVAQVLTYSGLAGVLLSRYFSETLSDLSEVAQVQGVSRWKFLWITKSLLYKSVGSLFLFIFAVSFSSFSIPLVLSGGRGTTLEILIYEKIKVSHEFGPALMMALFQSVLLGLLFWTLGSQLGTSSVRKKSSGMFSSGWGFLFLILFLFFQVVPWVGQTPEEWRMAWSQLTEAPDFWSELLGTGITSLKLSFASMALVTLMCGLASYLITGSYLPTIVRSYFPLSVSLLGLSGILMSTWVGNEASYLISFALMIFPALMRLTLESRMESLRSHIQVAQVLGAQPSPIFFKIVLPQIQKELSLVAGMTFLWTLGDFAVVRFFLPSGSTLTLMIESLMTSYRIQGALLLGLLVLFLGGFVQLVLWKVFDVPSSKSSQKLL